MIKPNLPFAVVLSIEAAGYGAVRSLSLYDIPIIGFLNDLSIPEAKTSLCQEIIQFDNDKELLDKLIVVAKSKQQKPVLILNSDKYVEFFESNRRQLQELFLIHYPENATVTLLLNKILFSQYAPLHNILIPNSGELRHPSDVEIFATYEYPVVIKPYLRTATWNQANFPKAFYANSFNELCRLYKTIKPVEEELIVQEWIPGPDSNIYYCLVYYDADHRCLDCFAGQKLRQWPTGRGNTSSSISTDNNYIVEESKRIFGGLNYSGFGSIEYKLHEENNRYYLIEPTVGRVDQQEYTATANGINIPLTAYNSLTGANIKGTMQQEKPVVYIDEWADIYSTISHFKERSLTVRQWYKSIQGRRAYRFWDKRDKRVFMFSLLRTLNNITNLAKWTQLIRKKPTSIT